MKDYSQILREMDEDDQKSSSFSFKHVVIGLVVVAIAGAGATGFYLTKQKNTSLPNSGIIEPNATGKELVPLDVAPKENTQVYDLFQQNE